MYSDLTKSFFPRSFQVSSDPAGACLHPGSCGQGISFNGRWGRCSGCRIACWAGHYTQDGWETLSWYSKGQCSPYPAWFWVDPSAPWLCTTLYRSWEDVEAVGYRPKKVWQLSTIFQDDGCSYGRFNGAVPGKLFYIDSEIIRVWLHPIMGTEHPSLWRKLRFAPDCSCICMIKAGWLTTRGSGRNPSPTRSILWVVICISVVILMQYYPKYPPLWQAIALMYIMHWK